MFDKDMKTIDLVNSELIRVRDSLKTKDEAELKNLSKVPIKMEYDVFGKKFPLVIFSESDPDGTLNIIAEITKYHLMGTSTVYSQGFKLNSGEITNLTEQELWEFD